MERQKFEKWYVGNAFDFHRDPIGSRDCSLQWEAWEAAISGTHTELFGYWDEEYNCFVPLDVAKGLTDLDHPRIHFLPLFRITAKVEK